MDEEEHLGLVSRQTSPVVVGRPRHHFDIIIPEPRSRPPGVAEKVLAFVISRGKQRKGEMAGLTGKPLLYNIIGGDANSRYFTSVFVSLGVFLFGMLGARL